MSNLLENKPDAAAAFLRATLGVLFMAHVGLKVLVFTPAGTAGYFQSIGLPGFLAYLTILVELLGAAAQPTSLSDQRNENMKIAVVGTGGVGSGFAIRLAASGHDVVTVGSSVKNGLDPADRIVAGGHSASAAFLADAVAVSDVIALAVPYGIAVDLVGRAALDGKVVIDLTNPVKEDFSSLSIGHTTSAAEEIASAAPKARIVKAFNTIFAEIYTDGPELAGRAAPTFIASDDAEAKKVISGIAADMGFDPVDAGPLSNARYIEPLAYLNIQFGYMLGHGTKVAPARLSR